MAYVQKNNPIAKTPCGRRRTGGIGRGAFKFDPSKLGQAKGTAENLKNPKFGVKDVDFPPGGPVTNMTVPFGGGKLGKAIKLGKIAKNLFKKKLDVPLVIMAGGIGKRLRPYTLKKPKPLMNIGGNPLIDEIIKNAQNAGIKTIYISVNYMKNKIIEINVILNLGKYFHTVHGNDLTFEYLKINADYRS